MSTKTWKNKELTTLLSEAWGFGFNLDNLKEATPRVGYGTDGEAVEDPDKEEEEVKGLEETKDEDLDESRGLAKRRGGPMSKRAEQEAGYDTDAEVWRRGGKGVEVQPGPEDDDDDDVPSPRSTRGAAPPPPRLRETKLNEDSGEDEAWHEWKNEHADDDHIREMEHHLRALKEDRDYERHGAEYDHDKYEDEGEPVDEGGSGRSDPTRMQGRDSARDLPDRKRPMEEQALRRMVRRTIRKIYQENKK